MAPSVSGWNINPNCSSRREVKWIMLSIKSEQLAFQSQITYSDMRLEVWMCSCELHWYKSMGMCVFVKHYDKIQTGEKAVGEHLALLITPRMSKGWGTISAMGSSLRASHSCWKTVKIRKQEKQGQQLPAQSDNKSSRSWGSRQFPNSKLVKISKFFSNKLF